MSRSSQGRTRPGSSPGICASRGPDRRRQTIDQLSDDVGMTSMALRLAVIWTRICARAAGLMQRVVLRSEVAARTAACERAGRRKHQRICDEGCSAATDSITTRTSVIRSSTARSRRFKLVSPMSVSRGGGELPVLPIRSDSAPLAMITVDDFGVT